MPIAAAPTIVTAWLDPAIHSARPKSLIPEEWMPVSSTGMTDEIESSIVTLV
jgi:hypothetical protein